MSSAVALAVVATLGVPQAWAQKGKEKRKHNPLKIVLAAENLTTHKRGTSITASAGDEVVITLEVSNFTGTAQTAVVDVLGGIPGCMIHEVVNEYFEAGQTKSASYSGIVPADQSGVLTVDVSVLMPKTSDTGAVSADVAFNMVQKNQAPSSSRFFERAFAKMLVHALVTLDDGAAAPSTANMSEMKSLYR